ncbi:MAG: response regulator transcription factor [Saprospiraceae bacterium]|nr:response regulator transcription factor [Saprospiraceae bacterium]MBK8295687.1 response regulator transcription factor [Saprospiraceae bacterium]
MQNLKISIFDDNKPRRDLLQLLINSTTGFSCKNVYNDCRNVLKEIAANTPDIILMDINMPHVDGIEGLKLIKSQFPRIKILMQTIFEDEDKIFKAIVAGADGYILKKTSPDKLIDAIRDLAEGGAPMTPTVAKQVLTLFNNKHHHIPKNDFNLTARESEILKFLVEGYSYKKIAEECNVSYATVNSHICHIYEKLHVSSGTEAVAKVLEYRIIRDK